MNKSFQKWHTAPSANIFKKVTKEIHEMEEQIDTENLFQKLDNKIAGKEANYLLIEEIWKNITAIEGFQFNNKKISQENSNGNNLKSVIDQINQKFIVEEIVDEIQNILSSSYCISQSDISVQLMELDSQFKKKDKYSNVNYSKSIRVFQKFIKSLKQLNKKIRKRLRRKCLKCSSQENKE